MGLRSRDTPALCGTRAKAKPKLLSTEMKPKCQEKIKVTPEVHEHHATLMGAPGVPLTNG